MLFRLFSYMSGEIIGKSGENPALARNREGRRELHGAISFVAPATVLVKGWEGAT